MIYRLVEVPCGPHSYWVILSESGRVMAQGSREMCERVLVEGFRGYIGDLFTLATVDKQLTS